MGNQLASYLRTHRRKSGLSQREVAQVLGFKTGQIISRYEHLSRIPSLKSALACRVLFDVEPHELFPGLYAEVEKLTIMRIRALGEPFSIEEANQVMRHRQASLEDAIRRAEMNRTSL